MATDELKKYELMVIFSGEMPESDIEREAGEMKKLLKEHAKAVTYEESWGRRNFSYRIKKQGSGYYLIFNFDALPEIITELRANIKLNPIVLRHLLITVPQDYIPGRYKEFVLPMEKDEKTTSPRSAKRAITPPIMIKEEKTIEEIKQAPPLEDSTSSKPKVAGKQEEEQLESVEKKLEKILENPDIDIR